LEVAIELKGGRALFNNQTFTGLKTTDIFEKRIAPEDISAQQKFHRPTRILRATSQFLEGIRSNVGI
jgi:hypothetical protein